VPRAGAPDPGRRATSIDRPRVRRALGAMVVLFAVLCAATLLLQVARHAYAAELSGGDEPAHFVTSLLIRDYVAAGLPGSPIAYAENYYIHYPKIGFGMWPPVFHATAAAWMLVMPASVASVRVLIAIITALAALLAFRLIRDDVGTRVAAVIAAAFIALPLTQLAAHQVMVDALVAALVFATALAWHRYGRTLATGDALAFGLLGSAAMLTKGNGIAVLGLPFIWAAVTSRWDVLTRRATWYGLGLMLVVGGPWQVYSAGLLSRTVIREGGSGTLLARAGTYGVYLTEALGPAVLVMAGLGAALVLGRRLRKGPMADAVATPFALLLSVLAFHVVLPQAPNARYLLPALPICLWLAVRGMQALGAACAPRLRGPVIALLALLLVADVARLAVRFEPRRHHGIGAIADWVLTRPPGVVLVSDGDSAVNTSGMFIVEMAVREARPGHIVLRGNKTLSLSSWDGQDRRVLHDTVEEVSAFLAGIPVRYVVLDDGPFAGVVEPANEILRVALRNDAAWRLAGTYPDAANPRHRRLVYESTAAPTAGGPISIDLGRTLGRSLTLQPRRP